MSLKDWYQHRVQFDYYSDNFLQFERDFYRYSNLDTPLTFISDDLLMAMSHKGQPYFRLPAKYAKDYQDHYFIFQVKHTDHTDQVLNYSYIRHSYQL